MALVAKNDVLEASHIINQHEMLVHHADAMLNGHAWRGNLNLLAVHEDLSLSRLV